MEIPSEYMCPITQDIMKEPVCDNEGNTFDKQAIMRWLARNRTSPISRKPLRIADLRPNIALKNLISTFNDKNKETLETLKMREARLKRFDKSTKDSMNDTQLDDILNRTLDQFDHGSDSSRQIRSTNMIPPPDMSPVREPDPIFQDTLISDDTSEEELVFRDPPYTIPESITIFGGTVIQITHSSYDGHKYLCKNYCCVNIPMPTTGYCKKCRDAQRRNINISQSWNPKHPAFKIHKDHVKNYLQSKCPVLQSDILVFELETKDKFKCARTVIKDIRSHHLDRTRISDYPVSVDDEDIFPILQRFFN